MNNSKAIDFNSPLKRFKQSIHDTSSESYKKANTNAGFSGFASLLPCNEDPNEDRDDKIPHLSGSKKQSLQFPNYLQLINPPT